MEGGEKKAKRRRAKEESRPGKKVRREPERVHTSESDSENVNTDPGRVEALQV